MPYYDTRPGPAGGYEYRDSKYKLDGIPALSILVHKDPITGWEQTVATSHWERDRTTGRTVHTTTSFIGGIPFHTERKEII